MLQYFAVSGLVVSLVANLVPEIRSKERPAESSNLIAGDGFVMGGVWLAVRCVSQGVAL